MAEQPILRLSPKQWLSGIAPNAHTETGGIFYKANGITPLYDAGGTASPENGMLQAGPTPTDFTGSVIVDKPIASVTTSVNGAPEMYILGDAGHFYKKTLGAGAPTDLRSGTPVVNTTAPGMFLYATAAGSTYLYYLMRDFLGRWNLSGTYPTGWSDSWQGVAINDHIRAHHKFVGNVYFGSRYNVSYLYDGGGADPGFADNILDLPKTESITGMTDDGQYLVISTTENYNSQTSFALNKIYFWDTFSSSWTKELIIKDPSVYTVKNINGKVYAFGQLGIYECSFSGVKKVLSRNIGFTTDGSLTNGYGVNRGLVYNNSTLMFATDTTIDTYGKLQPDVPVAYLKNFKIPSGYPTWINADFDAGRVYVGTTTPKLYAYDFNATTHDSGNTAQTVYFKLPAKYQINRIDLVFGEPLASGDAISAGLYRDEDTAVTDFGATTFAVDGAVRRNSLYKQIICEEQISILVTFTSGAVKLKRLEIFGEPMTP